MKFLEKFNLNWLKVLKMAALVLVCVIVLTFVFPFLKSSLNFGSNSQMGNGLGYKFKSYDMDDAYYASDSVAESAIAPMLEMGRSVIPQPESEEISTGSDAEDFEVTEYSGTFETRDSDSLCAAIFDLKSFEYVIFEKANEYDRGCDYTFKVEHGHVEEVLTVLEELDPRELSKNVYTIKRRVEDVTSDMEILTKKKASIDSTLEEAMLAYESITDLATRNQDAQSLATIIDSKVNTIERLTQERININERLDRLAKAKAEQLDKLDYTYFYTNVYESKFIDAKNLKDSWKAAIQDFFYDANEVLQNLTINFIVFLFFVFQYVVYAFILLIMAKYFWKIAKYIWKK